MSGCLKDIVNGDLFRIFEDHKEMRSCPDIGETGRMVGFKRSGEYASMKLRFTWQERAGTGGSLAGMPRPFTSGARTILSSVMKAVLSSGANTVQLICLKTRISKQHIII